MPLNETLNLLFSMLLWGSGSNLGKHFPLGGSKRKQGHLISCMYLFKIWSEPSGVITEANGWAGLTSVCSTNCHLGMVQGAWSPCTTACCSSCSVLLCSSFRFFLNIVFPQLVPCALIGCSCSQFVWIFHLSSSGCHPEWTVRSR